MDSVETLVEQRSETRTELKWPVSVWVPAARRFFNGRSANVSKVGALISLPITTPVREGAVIEINFPRTTHLAKQKGQFARIKSGKVVRVDRGNILTESNIAVAVQFE